MITLKTTLTINALSSGATGIGLIVLAAPVAQLFEMGQVATFVGVGIFLVLFAAYVLFVSLRQPANATAVKLVIALDVLWVLASLIFVAVTSSAISAIGIMAIVAVAVWVGAMAFLQNKGLDSEGAM